MKEPYILVNEPLYGHDNFITSALSNETRAAYNNPCMGESGKIPAGNIMISAATGSLPVKAL